MTQIASKKETIFRGTDPYSCKAFKHLTNVLRFPARVIICIAFPLRARLLGYKNQCMHNQGFTMNEMQIDFSVSPLTEKAKKIKTEADLR